MKGWRSDRLPTGGDSTVAAVVVTHNRRDSLRDVLDVLTSSVPRSAIFVIDNGSTDGTAEMLAAAFGGVHVVSLKRNVGGAGGFARGLQLARDAGFTWIWISDDDAVPESNAVSLLHGFAIASPWPRLGMVSAVVRERSSGVRMGGWRLKGGARQRVPPSWLEEQPVFEVDGVPWLGVLVHRDVIAEVGLPDEQLVWGEDVEFCYRVRRAGFRIAVVAKAEVVHPDAERVVVQRLGIMRTRERIPLWKRYYRTRNRILLAAEMLRQGDIKRTQLWRQAAAAVKEAAHCLVWDEDGVRQCGMVMRGVIDGLRHRRGVLVRPGGSVLEP